MPDDALKQRAEAFGLDNQRQDFVLKKDLIAEIEWARENPPHNKEATPASANYERRVGWQSFADHLLQCLGEK